MGAGLGIGGCFACCCEQSRSDCASGRGSECQFLKFSCEPFGESASIEYKNAILPKPTFWTQILRHPLPQRKCPRHPVSSCSLSPRSVGAYDHLRHALMTAPPERPPPPSPSFPSFPTPEVSRCQIHLRPAGFVVPSEARDPLVWDQLAAHLALDHGPMSCGSALCPGGSAVMLLSSSRSARFLANVACRSFFFLGACPVLSPLC